MNEASAFESLRRSTAILAFVLGLSITSSLIASDNPVVVRDPHQKQYKFPIVVVTTQGQSVSGAKVTPFRIEHTWCRSTIDEKWGLEVTTNAEGIADVVIPSGFFKDLARQLSLEGQEPAILTLGLRIDHPEHPISLLDVNVANPSRIEPVKLSDAGTIDVRAHRETETTTLRDVMPVLSGYSGTPKDWSRIRESSQKDGQLQIPRVDLQSYSAMKWLRIVREPEGERPWFSSPINIERSETPVSLDVELRPGVSVAGKVDDNVPRPIVNGHVIARLGAGGADPENILEWRMETDIAPDGSFAFESVPVNEDLQLIAICDGWVNRSRLEQLVQLEKYAIHHGMTGNLDNYERGHVLPQLFRTLTNGIAPVIVMERTATCEVKVDDETGKPISGANVVFSPIQNWISSNANPLGTGGDSLKELRLQFHTAEVPHRDPTTPYTAKTNAAGIAFVANLPVANLDPAVSCQFGFFVYHDDYEDPFEPPSNFLRRRQSVELNSGKMGHATVRMQVRRKPAAAPIKPAIALQLPPDSEHAQTKMPAENSDAAKRRFREFAAFVNLEANAGIFGGGEIIGHKHSARHMPDYDLLPVPPSIRNLGLYRIEEAAWPLIGKLQSLECLDLTASDLRGHLDQLSQLHLLREFRVINGHFEAADLATLKQHPRLEKIDATMTTIEGTDAKRIQQLGELSADEQQWMNRWKASRGEGPGDINLANVGLLTDRALYELKGLKQLKTLNLTNAYITGRAAKSLSEMHELEVLDIGWLMFDLDAAKSIARLPALKSLTQVSVNDAILDEFVKLQNIVQLSAWADGTTDLGANSLSLCRKLQRLTLQGARFTDDGLDALLQLPDLQMLDLSSGKNTLSEAALERFREQLPDCKLILSEEKTKPIAALPPKSEPSIGGEQKALSVSDKAVYREKFKELEKLIEARDRALESKDSTERLENEIAVVRLRVAKLKLQIAEAGNRGRPGQTSEADLASLKRATLVRWGPLAGGFQIGLERVSLKDSFEPGEAVEFRLRVRNATKADTATTLSFVPGSKTKSSLDSNNQFHVTPTALPKESLEIALSPESDQPISGSEFRIETKGLLPGRYDVNSSSSVVFKEQRVAGKLNHANPPHSSSFPDDLALKFEIPSTAPPPKSEESRPFVLQGTPDIFWGDPVQGLQGGLRYTRAIRQLDELNHDENWDWTLGDTVDAEFYIRNVLPTPVSVSYAVAEGDKPVELNVYAHSVTRFEGDQTLQPRTGKPRATHSPGQAPMQLEQTRVLQPGEMVLAARMNFQLLELPPTPSDRPKSLQVNAIFVDGGRRYSFQTRLTVRGVVPSDLKLSSGGARIWMHSVKSKHIEQAPVTPAALVAVTGRGRVTLRYDMSGAASEAAIVIRPLVPAGEVLTKMVSNRTTSLEFELPSGKYEVFRRAILKVGEWEKAVACDQKLVQVIPDRTEEVVFTGPRANLVTAKGHWVTLASHRVDGAFLTVHRRAASSLDTGTPDTQIDFEAERETLSATTCGPDGRFTLEPLPPGDYVVILRAFPSVPSRDSRGVPVPYLVGAERFSIIPNASVASYSPNEFRIRTRWNAPQWAPTRIAKAN